MPNIISEDEQTLLNEIDQESVSYSNQNFSMSSGHHKKFSVKKLIPQFLQYRPSRKVVFISAFFVVLGLTILFSYAGYVGYQKSKIIPETAVLTRQISGAMVKGMPVKWLKLVKVGDLKKNQKLLTIPKQASNVKIKKFNASQGGVLLAKLDDPFTLNRDQRIAIAKRSNKAFLAQTEKFSKPSVATAQPSSLLGRALFDIEATIGDVGSSNQDSGPVQQVDIISAVSESLVVPEVSPTPVEPVVSLQEVIPPSEIVTPSEETVPNEVVIPNEIETPSGEAASSEEATSSAPLPQDENSVSDPVTAPEEQSAGGVSLETPSLIEEVVQTPIPEDAPTATLTPDPDHPTLKSDDYIAMEYETPAPSITEEKSADGKLVTVSVEQEDPVAPVKNVVAFANIPPIFKVNQKNRIKVQWKNEGDELVDFNAYDLNGDNYLDYVEWTIPHLSEQIFEIIFISKAFLLDQNREFINDIYDQVGTKDNQYQTVENGQYVRVTFEQELERVNDITLYAQPTNPGQPASVEVYAKDSNQLILTFPIIDRNDRYRMILDTLPEPTKEFDLKVINASLDIDYIVDPALTWDGGGATNNWSDCDNWMTNTCPSSSDTVTFNSTSTKNATIDTNISVTSITIAATYSGTITQSNGFTITTSGAYSQAAGTFTGGDSAIAFNGGWSLTGGTFTPTSNTITVKSAWNYTAGTYTAGIGTVKFTMSPSITVTGPQTLNNVTIENTTTSDYTVTLAGTLTVAGTLTFDNTSTGTSPISGTIAAQGNIVVADSNAYGGTAVSNSSGTLLINGTGDQTFTGSASQSSGNLPDVTINKASGTLTFSGTLRTISDWTYTAGTLSGAPSTLVFGFASAGLTITGSHTFPGNVTIDYSGASTPSMAIAGGATFTVTGTLTFDSSSSGAVILSTGTIAAQGNIVVADGLNYGASANGNSSGTLLINGTGDQTFTGSASQTAGNLPDVTINKASGTLTFSGTLRTSSDWTYTAGTLSGAVSNLVFNPGTGTSITIAGSHTFPGNVIIDYVGSSNPTVIISTGTTLTVTGTVTFDTSGSGSVILSTGTIAAQGDIVVADNLAYGSTSLGNSSATLLINGTGDQAFTGSATQTGGNLPDVTINKVSGTLTFSGTLRTSSNWTYTAGTISGGTSTVVFSPGSSGQTISGTHTLNNITIDSNGSSSTTLTISSGTLSAAGTLTFDNSNTAAILITGALAVQGNIVVADSISYGGALNANAGSSLLINGTGDQTFTGSATETAGNLPDLTINKVSGTLTFSGTLRTSSDWTYTAGTVSAGTSTVAFAPPNTGQTISGTHTLNNITINSNASSPYTLTVSSGTLSATGTLTIGNSNTSPIYLAGSGTIAAQGNIVVTDSQCYGSPCNRNDNASFTLLINGTGDQTFTGNATSSAGNLPNISINKSSGTLTFSGNFRTTGDFTYVTGTMAGAAANLYLIPTNTLNGDIIMTITGTATFPGNVTIDNSSAAAADSTLTINSGTFAVAGTLTFDNALNTYATKINGTGGFSAQGNIVVADANSYGSASGRDDSNIGLLINGAGDQSFTGSATQTSGNLPDIIINKPSGTLTFSGTLRTNGDWTYTAGTLAGAASTLVLKPSANTNGDITITGSHTLPGNVTIDSSDSSTTTITIANGTTLTVAGTLTFDNSSTGATTINTGTLVAQGDLTVADTRTYNGSFILNFTGGNNQTFTSGSGFAPTGNPVTINKSAGTLTLGANASFNVTNQDLNLTAGTLDLHGFNLTVNRTLTVSSGAIFQLYGSETMMVTTKTLNAGSTVKFTGNGDGLANTYIVTSYFNNSFKNLTIASTDAATDLFRSGITLTVEGTFSIASGSVYTLNGQNLTATGMTMDNSGTLKLQGGETLTNFTNDTAKGTVEYIGTTSYAGLKAGNTYYNLAFNGSGGTWTLGAPVTANNNLDITVGTLDTSSGNNYGVSVGGTWSRAGTFTMQNATLTLTGDSTFSDTMAFYNLTVNGSGKTVTLGNSLNVSNALTITAGTLNAGSQTITLSGTGTVFNNSGSFTAGTSTIDLTDTSSSSKTFAGGGGAFGNLTIASGGSGAILLTGSNSFNNVTINAPKTITFPSSATQTIGGTLTCTGSVGNIITINSSSPNTQATLSKASGAVDCDYLDLRDSNATGGASWNPGTHSADSGNNSGWVLNTAPSLSAGPSDGGSSSASPTGVGSSVAFTATATDTQSDNYYLAICKTNAITVINSGAPTCPGGSWTISDSTASGAQASASYTALSGDVESNIWYGFICDHNASSFCSASSQGSGNNGSPFAVNHVPAFSAANKSGSPAKLGASVTFTSTASDTDTDDTSDTVSLYICKDSDFTGSACGISGEWCHSSASASNPSCSYTIQAGDNDGSYGYYSYIIDNHGLGATTNPRFSAFVVDKTNPSTSASGNGYTFGNWSNANVTVSLSCSDSSGCNVTKYCTDITNTCTPTTTYTGDIIISAENTSYVRYYSIDNADNTESTASVTVKIDKVVPTVSAGSDQVKNILFTQDATVSDATSGVASYSWTKSAGPGNVTFGSATAEDTTVSADQDGSYTILLTVTDAAGNTNSDTFNLNWDTAVPVVTEVTPVPTPGVNSNPSYTFNTTEAGDIVYGGSCSSATDTATVGNNTITFATLGDGLYADCSIIVVDNLNNTSLPLFVSSFVISTAVYAPTNFVASSASLNGLTLSWDDTLNSSGVNYYVENLSDNTNSGWIANASFSVSGLQCATPYNFRVKARNATQLLESSFVNATVTTANCANATIGGGSQFSIIQSAPAVVVTSVQDVIQSIIQIPTQIIDLITPPKPPVVNYVPEVTEKPPVALIGQWDLIDPNKIRELVLAPLPKSLKEFAVKNEDFQIKLKELGINKITDVQRLRVVQLELPGISKVFKASDQVALAEIKKEHEKLPTDLIFARTFDDSIDINTRVLIDENGLAQQAIQVAKNRPINLIIRPAQPVENIKGYLVFISRKRLDLSQENVAPTLTQRATEWFLPQEVLAADTSNQALFPTTERRLVLQEFYYENEDKHSGIYTAAVTVPTDSGQYKIISVLNYKNPKLKAKEIEMTTVVDPEGYVYAKSGEGEVRIKDAQVSLFWLNPEIDQYQLWPAQNYSQENPQITGSGGNYSFLVPEGNYYLKVTSANYFDYQSKPFQVREGNNVHMNLELKPRYWWFTWTNWLIILGVLVALFVGHALLTRIFKKNNS